MGLTDRVLPMEVAERPLREYVVSVAVREKAFRYKVVDQTYDGRCVMTGMKITNGLGRAEADAAHIRPVHCGGPDVVTNGLALTKTMHWAFDRGLVGLSDAGRILTVERGLPDELRRLLQRDLTIGKPRNSADAPHPAFLAWHRENVFKGPR